MTFTPACPRCGNLCEPDATICDCGARTGITRFVVTEIHGDLTPRPGTGATPNVGMSAHVIDTAVCHRIVATYRTEDTPRRLASPHDAKPRARARPGTDARRRDERGRRSVTVRASLLPHGSRRRLV